MARLGLRTGFIGLVGDDPLGRYMVDAMAQRDIDTTGVQVRSGVPTGASVILAGGSDRAILTSRGTIPLLTSEDMPRDLLTSARHVHVGSLFLLDALRP